MNVSEPMDTLDQLDLICSNLDNAEGILAALEVTLSISDTHHHKLPFAVTAAMQFIAEARGGIKKLSLDCTEQELAIEGRI